MVDRETLNVSANVVYRYHTIVLHHQKGYYSMGRFQR